MRESSWYGVHISVVAHLRRLCNEYLFFESLASIINFFSKKSALRIHAYKIDVLLHFEGFINKRAIIRVVRKFNL